jgi:hypothetical protein
LTVRKVEMAVWTHHIISDLKPELLAGMPSKGADKAPEGENNSATSTDKNEIPVTSLNGEVKPVTASEGQEAALSKVETPVTSSDENETPMTSSDGEASSSPSLSGSLSCKRSATEDQLKLEGQPAAKKMKPARKLPIAVIRNC